MIWLCGENTQQTEHVSSSDWKGLDVSAKGRWGLKCSQRDKREDLWSEWSLDSFTEQREDIESLGRG